MNLTELHFPETPQVNGELPGPKAKEFLAAQQELESNVFNYSRTMPLVPQEARGATIKDLDGNVFIDFFAGIGVVNVGHSNPKVLAAARTQEERLIHSLDFPAVPRVELMRKLNEIAPSGLRAYAKVMFGGPSGSDTIEGAMKLAKHYTSRHTLIAFSGSYHGQTPGVLALSSGRGSFLTELRKLQEKVPQIGEVRGNGLWIAVELVKDRETKEPYPELVRAIQRRCYEKGLLIWSAGHYGNVVQIMPPPSDHPRAGDEGAGDLRPDNARTGKVGLKPLFDNLSGRLVVAMEMRKIWQLLWGGLLGICQHLCQSLFQEAEEGALE